MVTTQQNIVIRCRSAVPRRSSSRDRKCKRDATLTLVPEDLDICGERLGNSTVRRCVSSPTEARIGSRMGLFGWLKGNRNSVDPRLAAWRQAWSAARANPDQETVVSLRQRLDALHAAEEEIEIEREMLEGIAQLVELRNAVGSAGLPVVETGHRVVGHDTCHFSTTASMPDDAAQPAGRLLLTNARVIFAGGGKATTLPWHAVSQVVQDDRDLVLLRRDRDTIYRFRCNSYADALCGAFVARRLASIRAGASAPAAGM
jgi:hypothetical protein